ncbi:hypothetical protein H6P81_008136 [Aristolochia fimbriata]|uniref:RING-type domain-containing protein n=1 Tax=Aristolochia fimbriata TaxID=158543 RepID=A0AAV7F5G3_ARIFI|nr:hypothetical protein H6P81_008136 [Aristolochia fimbriata]
MTKKLTAAPMELDLDSFLEYHSTDSDSDNDQSSAAPRRTVDDILNESDSDASSSGDSPRPGQVPLLSPKPPPKREPELVSRTYTKSNSDITASQANGAAGENPKAETGATPTSRVSAFGRGRPGELLGDSFPLGRSYSRPLPQLFGGIKPQPKPGAALAAAAAASRSIPSPHAAAIKIRWANSDSVQKVGLDQRSEILGSDTAEEKIVLDDVSDGAGSVSTQEDVDGVAEDRRASSSPKVEGGGLNNEEVTRGDEAAGIPQVRDSFPEKLEAEEHGNQDVSSGDDAAEILEAGNYSPHFEEPKNESTEDAILEGSDSVNVKNLEEIASFSDPAIVEEHINSSGRNSDASSKVDECAAVNELTLTHSKDDKLILLDSKGHGFDNESSLSKDGDANTMAEDADSRSDSNELVQDLLGQFHSYRRSSKKSGKKVRSSMKPLELAEELEKKYASSGLHWEEGAAAQPMRLEGIRRGPPAVGYLQVDPRNAVSRAVSSQSFRRDHGTPQALAVHFNFIAVGLSKGNVLLMPSKYSAHSPDSMDSKMLMLGSQGEKPHSPVTSMCFNQQGDLLLAGYGDGRLTVWDTQRATPVKTITGEHTAPVVHTLFLAQDSQVTRQFKAVTGDCKGLVLLHAFSVVPLLNRVSIKTQCLLDGQRTGTVLSASPLLVDDYSGSGVASGQGYSAGAPGSLGGMVGGVVGGVVGGEAGWKLFSEASSLVEEGVVIFVTNQTALVVRLTPTLEVYAQLSRPEGVREGSMPYTAWKCRVHLRGSSNETAPEVSDRASLLAIAWDKKVQVAKLVNSELNVYREWTIDSTAIGVAWLDDKMLVVLTLRGHLCLFSLEGTELHRTSFIEHGSGGDEFITYHTFFNNTFGNPEKAYQNSVAVRGATIYVLGPSNLVVSRLLPWKERIQVLHKAGDWMGALDMAMRLYDGHAHGVIDLPKTVNGIRETIMPYLVELLLSYVDEVFSYISVAFSNQVGNAAQPEEQKTKNSSLDSEIEDQYARVGGVAVEFCVHIKRIDVLFDDIFSRFVAVQQGGTFLELLEPYILKDVLGCLPPEIMQALVEHYSSKGWLQRVEQCVLHMDISSLDFNQVVKLCREHGLYGALIYLFNRGLDDFRTPLEELLVVVQNNEKTYAAEMGYKMLVYLKYCFLGLAFPPGHGTIPPSRLRLLRTELLQFLLEESNVLNPRVRERCKSSTNTFPNLCCLLQLDTEAALEVISCAFPEDSPRWDQCNDFADESVEEKQECDIKTSENQHMIVQNTVDAIVQILQMETQEMVLSSGTEDDGSLEVWPSKNDIGHMLEFVSYLVSCKGAMVSKSLLDRILEYLTSECDPLSDGSTQMTEIGRRREKQVLTLLKGVSQTDWNSSSVLQLCEKAQFHQACGFIHTIRGDYCSALDSFMKDTVEPVHAFAFINNKLLLLRDSELASFESIVVCRIPELVNLSREGTLFLVLDHFNKETHQVLSALQAHPKSLFLYLKTIIEVHLRGALNFSSLERHHDLDVPFKRMMNAQTGEVKAYLERLSSFSKLLSHNPIHVTDEMAELYLELLCQYDRSSVLNFLETFENYQLERCLRLCQDYEVTDAAAFLLERAGDVPTALSLTLSGLGEKLHVLDAALEKRFPQISSGRFSEIEQFDNILEMQEVSNICDVLHASVGLCQRNTPRLDPQESESLWFRLLDSFFLPLRELYCDKKKFSGGHSTDTLGGTEPFLYKWRISRSEEGAQIFQRLLCRFIREVVEGMIGYIPLSVIMAKLLSDNGTLEFGDFKLTILGMLGTYGYERRILDTAKSLIEDDTFYSMSLLKKGASHGYAPQSFACCICGSILSKDASTSSIRVFGCGHATHLQCESLENGALDKESSLGCPICMPKKKSLRSKTKSTLVDIGRGKSFLLGTHLTHGNTAVQHSHEPELVEKPYGLQHMSRFEILSCLSKAERSLQIDTMPHLRLAPPAIYQEKVKKATDIIKGESSNRPSKGEQSSKMKQARDLRTKASSLRIPLKSGIFSTANRR